MKNKKPLISIITPSYNQGQYIEETIRSVLLQDYPNIEYIIIDGGSNDSSVEVIKKYENKIAYFVSEKDNGQSDAINKGFKRANGEYIAWLNSDDVYTEKAVSKAVKALQENPDCGFVYANVLSMDMNSSVFNTMTFGDWGLAELMQFKVICQPGLFMRKSALDAVGFLDPDYDYLMDHHLWLKIAAKYPIKHVNDFWAAARYHPTAKNLTGGAHYGDEAFILYNWMKTQPEMQTILNESKRKIGAGAHHLRARYLLDSGESWKAFQSYVEAAYRDFDILAREKNRIGFALLNSIVPINGMRRSYLNKRTQEIQKKNFDRMLAYIRA